MVLGMMLEKAGFDRVVVASGDAVLDALSVPERVDAVVLDVSMPGISGIDAIKLIRVAEADGHPGHRVPIVAVSFDRHWRTKRDCLEAGADDFIAQPVSLKVLIATVRRLMAERETGRGLRSNVLIFPGKSTVQKELPADLVDARFVEELIALGGKSRLQEIARALKSDFEVALGYMRKAVEAGDLREFREQLFNLASAAGNLGAPRIRTLYDRTIGCDEEHLRVEGSSIVERLTLECYALCDFLLCDGAVPSNLRTSLPIN